MLMSVDAYWRSLSLLKHLVPADSIVTVPGSLNAVVEVNIVGPVTGRRYTIHPYSQTEICSKGRTWGYACLQFKYSNGALPEHDRMLAEYFLIRNDEKYYLSKANVFRRHSLDVRVAETVMVVVIALLGGIMFYECLTLLGFK